jgi:hypothetical protein
LITAFGKLVDPDVKRNFAILSAWPVETACSTARPGRQAASSANDVTLARFAVLRPATISPSTRSSALANDAVSAT